MLAIEEKANGTVIGEVLLKCGQVPEEPAGHQDSPLAFLLRMRD